MPDRDKNRNADRRHDRSDRRLRNERGDENRPTMEAAEEFDARRTRRARDDRRMETAGDLGAKRDRKDDRRKDDRDDRCCDDDR